jgi:hypothetical protein
VTETIAAFIVGWSGEISEQFSRQTKMARNQSDREDLLGEATGLVERIELEIADRDEPIVAGYRANGALSVFFGAGLVYQFNTLDELRRSFADACPITTKAGKLVVMRRVEEANRTVLRSRVFSDVEHCEFLSQAGVELANLEQHLSDQTFRIVGQVPADADIVARLRSDLIRMIAQPIRIADRPNVQ